MRVGILGSLMIVLGLWNTTTFAGNLVVNGGFEIGATSGVLSPSFAGDTIYVFGVGGQTNIGGWTVTNSGNNNGSATPLSVLVTANLPQVPASGTYALDFDPFWNVQTGAILGPTVEGTLPQISQVIDLAAGQYVLSFAAAVEQPDLFQSRSVTVTLSGGATLSELPTTSRPDFLGYDQFSYVFTSNGNPVTLTFTPNDFSAEPNFMLDNVSITSSVPEPSSFALLGLGGIGLALRACRRRRGVMA